MHMLCIKRSVFEQMPVLGQNLLTAFRTAQDVARDRIYDATALSVMLPWLVEHLFETEAVLGEDYWPSGFKKNQATLAKIIEYMRDDALITTAFTPEDLFDDKALLQT